MKVLAVVLAFALAAPAFSQTTLPTLQAPGPGGLPPVVAPPPLPTTPPPTAPPPAPLPTATPPMTASPPGATPSTTGAATSTSGGGSGSSSGITDADVLVFAYNLECLEGQFYSCAAFGTPLDTSITGNGPAPSSCRRANLSDTVGTYAAELSREEAAHVRFLYQALTAAGGQPVCPEVNIDTAFEAAAEAAFNQAGTPLSPTFDPYANDVFFLHGSFIFEDLGVSAYLGGQNALTNATYRQYAGQVGNAEAYHAALGRALLYPMLQTTPAYGRTVAQITGAIVSAINTLAGQPQLKYELTNQQGSSISNVDSTGFVPVATPTQVAKVVTLGAPAGTGGGFFPNNLVGNIKN